MGRDEIQVGVQMASWVERRRAVGARPHFQVLADGEFACADPTEDRLGSLFVHWPLRRRVIRTLLVTEMAGIVLLAAPELNSDYVQRRPVMLTSCLVVDRTPQDSTHHRAPPHFASSW